MLYQLSYASSLEANALKDIEPPRSIPLSGTIQTLSQRQSTCKQSQGLPAEPDQNAARENTFSPGFSGRTRGKCYDGLA
jgi:hypothetical protein